MTTCPHGRERWACDVCTPDEAAVAEVVEPVARVAEALIDRIDFDGPEDPMHANADAVAFCDEWDIPVPPRARELAERMGYGRP